MLTKDPLLKLKNWWWTNAGYDSDAQAYFDQLTSPSTAFKDAYNTAVLALKALNVYAKYPAIYPFPTTATAADFAVNAVNPGTYDVTWVNTTAGMFTANGFNGAGSGYGKTGLVPSTALNLNDHSTEVYISAGTTAANTVEFGARATAPNRFCSMAVRFGDDNNYFFDRDLGTTVSNTSNVTGHYLMTRRAANDLESYKRGTSIATQTSTAAESLPPAELYIGARNWLGTVELKSSRTISLVTALNQGVSDAEAAAINDIWETFQTAQGRGL